MSVSVQCDQCHKQYAVPDEWAGKRAKCKECGHLLAIPVPAAPAPLDNPLTDLLDEALGADMADGEAMGDPFAAAPPEGAGSGPLQRLPSKRRRPSGELTFGGLAMAFGRSQKLITAVLAGMCWVFLCALYDLLASGLGGNQIASGILLVVGLVIVGGGLQAGTPHRNRSKDKLRAGRTVGWMIGGIMGIACSIGVTVAVGRMGLITDGPALARLLMPFVIVFGLVTLISGLMLTYYVLVLLFPKTNIFRIAGWGYVALTVVIPIMLLTLGIMLKAAVKTLDQLPSSPSASERFDHSAAIESSFGRRESSRDRHESTSGHIEGPTHSGPKPGGVADPATGASRPSSFDSAKNQLAETYGPERVVTVEISNLHRRYFGRVIAKLHRTTTVPGFLPRPTDSGAIIAVAPVDDIQAFADKLDLGKVTRIDVTTRTITIEYDGNL